MLAFDVKTNVLSVEGLCGRHADGMRLFSDAFSDVVKQFREARKLSRASLAQKAGLHQTYIGLLERGERSPNLDTAKAIADALGVSLGRMVMKAEKGHHD